MFVFYVIKIKNNDNSTGIEITTTGGVQPSDHLNVTENIFEEQRNNSFST